MSPFFFAAEALLSEESVVATAAEAADEVVQKTSVLSEFFESLGLAGLSSILTAIIVFIICAIFIRVVTAAVDRVFARGRLLDETVKRFLRTAIRICLWVIALVIVAGTLGIPTASLVAIISVAGLALSLSMQTILSNLFAGVTLLFTRPLAVGEFAEVAGISGTVHSVGMFYTTINTPNGQVVTIPNSTVAGATITNYGRQKLRRAALTFDADYDDPTEDVKAALLDAAASVELVLAEPAPAAYITAFKDSTIEYTLHAWCDTADYWTVFTSLNEAVRKSFDDHGVHMSFNHINVHMMEK